MTVDIAVSLFQVKPTTHLPIAHQRGVLSHQYVGTKEEDKGVAEAQQRPVQERSEGQQGVLADVPEGHKWLFVISCTIRLHTSADTL